MRVSWEEGGEVESSASQEAGGDVAEAVSWESAEVVVRHRRRRNSALFPVA